MDTLSKKIAPEIVAMAKALHHAQPLWQKKDYRDLIPQAERIIKGLDEQDFVISWRRPH